VGFFLPGPGEGEGGKILFFFHPTVSQLARLNGNTVGVRFMHNQKSRNGGA